MMNSAVPPIVIVSTIQKLPVLLQSARYIPDHAMVKILYCLIDRMALTEKKVSGFFPIRNIAQNTVEEYLRGTLIEKASMECLRKKWNWDKKKLIDVLTILWEELNK